MEMEYKNISDEAFRLIIENFSYILIYENTLKKLNTEKDMIIMGNLICEICRNPENNSSEKEKFLSFLAYILSDFEGGIVFNLTCESIKQLFKLQQKNKKDFLILYKNKLHSYSNLPDNAPDKLH